MTKRPREQRRKEEIERQRLVCKTKKEKRIVDVCVCVFERKASSVWVGYQLHNLFSVEGTSSATHKKEQ